MTEGALGAFVTGSFVVKITSFFFIGRRYHFLHFFVVWFRLFDVLPTRNHLLTFIARIVQILLRAQV